MLIPSVRYVDKDSTGTTLTLPTVPDAVPYHNYRYLWHLMFFATLDSQERLHFLLANILLYYVP